MSKKSRKSKNLKLLLLLAFALIVVFVILYNFPSETGILLTTPTTTTTQPTTTTTGPETNCTDTDGGINYYERGMLENICAPGAACGVWVDTCLDSEILLEYYCDDLNGIRYECPYGCEAGACKKAKGTVIIAFKDEDQKIPGGAVLKSMNFTVTGIGVYDEFGEWVSVLDGEKTVDLLKYTTTLAKISEKGIDARSYGKIKLGFSEGSISLTNTLLYIYRPRVYDLIVPNETIVEYEFNITDGETLTLTLDFDIWNSVSHIAEGYIMDPVIIVSEQSGSATNMKEI